MRGRCGGEARGRVQRAEARQHGLGVREGGSVGCNAVCGIGEFGDAARVHLEPRWLGL